MSKRLSPGLRLFLLVVVALLAGAAAIMAGRQAAAWALRGLLAEVQGRLEVYAQSLDVAVERFAHLPYTVALDPAVAALARAPDDPALASRVNRYLAAVGDRAGNAVLYLIGPDGNTLAAGNWDRPGSFVGVNFAYRPYFQTALAGGEGRFYGVGNVTGIPGYFIASPVRDGDRVIGVVVAKVSLDTVEAVWREAGDAVLVTDRFGVAFLASRPDWTLQSIRPLDETARRQLAETKQYGTHPLPELPFSPALAMADPVRWIPAGPAGEEVPFVLARKPLGQEGWTMLLLGDASVVVRTERTAMAGVALIGVLAGVMLFAWRQRRRRLSEQIQAQAALERAYGDLEHKVAERTADLEAAKGRLEREVEQRTQAEQELRAAQNDLVQAAKMAVLGQMAAGVTHELNQPLTALRGLADNAAQLLDQGRESEARENLTFIAQLVDRMSKITAQLRGFSRRGDGAPSPVPVATAVREALALVERRFANERIIVDVDVPSDIKVAFEPVRLQQVLVNLLRNAADAVKGMPDPFIEIALQRTSRPGLVALVVRDNGPGIPDTVRGRIFDPFFTTKPAGEGLGLGLAISLAIARDYGGTLEASSLPTGAEFILTLTEIRTGGRPA